MKKIPFSEDTRFDASTTLFVTDLDGTLLTPDAVLPEGAAKAAGELYDKGVKLTYATARTIRSAAFILDGMPFSAPVSLMNGVLMRDMTEGRYVSSEMFSADTARRILSLGGEPFVYTLTEDGELYTAYRRLANVHMKEFLNERTNRYGKPFRQLNELSKLIGEGQRIIYFAYLDTRDALMPIYEAVSTMCGSTDEPLVKCAFYADHYREGLWYLEVFAKTASKANAIRRLRELTGVQSVVCFGDNTNDLPMFRESDYAFAVDTAVDELKAEADGIVGGGMGILRFILERVICGDLEK